MSRVRIHIATACAFGACALAVSGPSAQAQQGAPAQTRDEPTLSEKLDRTDGVIKPPPSGDADMTQAPPNVGATMPIIPPSSVTPPGEPQDGPKPEPK